MEFSPNGLLVLKSVPDGAEIYLNGELETATNATISLAPATYSVVIKKEGYKQWEKSLTIKKEEVTESTAYLFKSAPSLSAMTFSQALQPVPSEDFSKIAYMIPLQNQETTTPLIDTESGLWIMELVSLPLGFARDPRRITDGSLEDTTWMWSPNGREILLTTKIGSFLLPTNTFTSQAQRVNITAIKESIVTQWEEERFERNVSKLKKLPEELSAIFTQNTSALVLSPDEEMILYTAKSDVTIPEGLIQPLPGSSTQEQERAIKSGRTYVYDIKEDRNFLIDNGVNKIIIQGGLSSTSTKRISWFPTSRHLILSEDSKITIFDYDGTNRQEVYSGNYVAPHAYPTLASDRIIILTNLGANSNPPNLYSLSIR